MNKSNDFLKQARKLAKESARILKYRGSRLDPTTLAECRSALAELRAVLAETGKTQTDEAATEKIRKSAAKLQKLLESNAKHLQTGTVREYVESIGSAVILALLVRAFLFEAFHIPTGSMIPTVSIADHMFVNKYVYGLRLPFTHIDLISGSEPKRGEVVVFDYPVPGENFGHAFLKRVVAGPGDKVRLAGNVLEINGNKIQTSVIARGVSCDDDNLSGCLCDRQKETVGDTEYITQHIAGPRPGFPDTCRNEPEWPVNNPMSFGSPVDNPDFPYVVVPEGHVLCMGDNRDNSSDGRYWGFVPIENLRGRATIFWWPLSKIFKKVR